MAISTEKDLYNLLVTRDFDPEILDSQGKSVTDPGEAEMFSFDWKTANQNYGTVVILLGPDQDLQVYYGDNLGRAMEGEDKSQWYDFLAQLKQFATRNLLTFETQNLNRLKYTMQGMAAIKEGLFEGYYGNRKISYSDQPKQTRLMIRHNRDLGEGDARYRAIESLFVETADGERFRVPSRSLMHGKMLARHIAEGGTPYDAFGQHITDTVTEMATLSRFIRAAGRHSYGDDAQHMVEMGIKHYADLKAKAKRMISQRGYREERERFDPAAITETEQLVAEIRTMFVEQTLDSRIEEALPILARLKDQDMKEAQEFAAWSEAVTEGTWALPNSPETRKKLENLMSQELIAGPDGINATEQLYDLVGDDELFDIIAQIAATDPDTNVWSEPRVQERMMQLGIKVTTPEKNSTAEALVGPAFGSGAGGLQANITESDMQYQQVRKGNDLPTEGDIHHIPGGSVNTDLLPGSRNLQIEPEDYSDTLYFRDPLSNGVFSFYYHGRMPRIRGTDGMSEQRVAEIAQELALRMAQEDLDVDGVMMTRPSNMSSESRMHDEFRRLVELAKG